MAAGQTVGGGLHALGLGVSDQTMRSAENRPTPKAFRKVGRNTEPSCVAYPHRSARYLHERAGAACPAVPLPARAQAGQAAAAAHQGRTVRATREPQLNPLCQNTAPSLS